MNKLVARLNEAVEKRLLLPSSRKNLLMLLEGTASPTALAAVSELVEGNEWGELNDRFFATLAFGTGGLRGRTIGRVVTETEAGDGGPNDRPEHPCVGTATLNFYNLSRAVRGLLAWAKEDCRARGVAGKPLIVFAHDTRHFSRDFAEFCAGVCCDLGADAALFESSRSTPQLSFTVRELNAAAGVVLTASHNPSHDNGFKAYGSDGAQLVEPAASRVIAEVNAIVSESYEALPLSERGEIRWLGEEMDRRYMDRLRGHLLRPELVAGEPIKVVFTNLHGTGGQIIVPMLSELGFEVSTVLSQDERDGRFPTVDSPNPENGPALAMAIRQADDEGIDLVIGTDPDADRMGVAARTLEGDMELLTGNQIGSLMAWYRINTMIDLGLLNEANRGRAVVVKTFVTTELQRAIAEAAGVSVVNTLTGFKYIAAKLKKYEDAIPADKKGAGYRSLSEEQTRALRLEYSRFFVFGGEESYGYLGCDYVRDKDANGAAVMFAEVAAYARSEELTLGELLDRIYDEFGFYLERGKAMVMEGADGALKISALAASYSQHPPTVVDGSKVTRVRDFARDELYDEEGDLLPKEGMLFIELEDGRAFAVRPSGTEPKIKFYLFGHANPGGSLTEAKDRVYAAVEAMWEWVESDAHRRMKDAPSQALAG